MELKNKKILIILILSGLFADIDKQIDSIIDSLNSIRSRSPERAIRYAREILSNPNYQTNQVLESKVYNSLGEVYLKLGLPSLALANFIESNQKGKIKNTPWITINIGNVYFMEEEWLLAKEKYLNALDSFRRYDESKANSINGKSVALNNLGLIEMHLEHYDDALVYFKEALSLRRGSARYKMFQHSKSELNITYAHACNSVAYQHGLLAILYTNWGLNDMALEQLQVSDSLLNFINNNNNVQKLSRITAQAYLGNNHSLRTKILTLLKNYDAAYQESKLAVELLKGKPIDLAEHFIIEANLFSADNDVYSALESIDNGLVVCELNGLSALSIELLNEKLTILEANKLENSALDIANKIIGKKEILSNSRMDMLLESLDYKADYVINRKRLEEAKIREIIIFLISGLIMIFFGFLVQNNRNRRKASVHKTLIEEQKSQLLKNELIRKESELIEMSAYIVSKNDLLNSIEKDLSYHTSLLENKSDRKIMEPLKKKIKNKIDDSADWQKFQGQFAIAYPGFVENLTGNFPTLRSSEVKICCYLKMNMNTKDIAGVTGLSVRAIENKRYRLRKKLHLEKETSLDEFIHSVNSINE